MLQYMIILLDDTSTSFCHYETTKTERNLISLDNLRKAIRLAMIENVTAQMVYPAYELPQEYYEVINTIDHSDIAPLEQKNENSDVIVLKDWQYNPPKGCVAVVRATLAALLEHGEVVNEWLKTVARLNVVITDVDTFTDDDQKQYADFLQKLGKGVEQLFMNGLSPQLNLLTDRMMLTSMNNCGAGDTCITLAPNGKFYICPAFYYENPDDNVGDLEQGINIPNKQLYKLGYAPICRECDSWHCKRCVWLNRKLTLEVNTPSHEQCVMAHTERNASRQLMVSIREKGIFLPDKELIPEIDYLDPFNKIKK